MGASGGVQDQNRFNRMGSASGGALTDLYGKMLQNGMYGGQNGASTGNVPFGGFDGAVRQGKDGSSTGGQGYKIYAPERRMPSPSSSLPGQNMRQGK